MAGSTYSPNLRIQLIATGDQAGAWGNTTDINLGTLVEGAIAGWSQISITATPTALTASNGATDQARLAMLQFTGASSAYTVYAPPNPKQYIIYNNTSYTLTFGNSTVINGTTASGGTTITIPAGATTIVYTDGTNMLSQVNYLPGNLTVNGTYYGAGTGLTGTASSLSVSSAAQITNSGGWNVTPSGTKLYFNYNGTNVGSLDSSGNFIAKGNVTAYGTP